MRYRLKLWTLEAHCLQACSSWLALSAFLYHPGNSAQGWPECNKKILLILIRKQGNVSLECLQTSSVEFSERVLLFSNDHRLYLSDIKQDSTFSIIFYSVFCFRHIPYIPIAVSPPFTLTSPSLLSSPPDPLLLCLPSGKSMSSRDIN